MNALPILFVKTFKIVFITLYKEQVFQIESRVILCGWYAKFEFLHNF